MITIDEVMTAQYEETEFDPSLLTDEQQAMVVEHYLGIHPKYMLIEMGKVKVNYGRMKADGIERGKVRWKNLKKVLV